MPGSAALAVPAATPQRTASAKDFFFSIAQTNAAARASPAPMGHSASTRGGSASRIPSADAAWSGRQGHVQAHLAEAIEDRRNLDFYLCGLKEMVDDVRALLKSLGFDRKQIFYEKYD